MAMLVDERGVISGMITLENVLEQLVGQIQDEFDDESPFIQSMDNGDYEVDASCPLMTLTESIEFDTATIEADTLGGAITQKLGHIPTVGEKVVFGSHHVTVLAAEESRVIKVKISQNQDPEPESEDSHPSA